MFRELNGCNIRCPPGWGRFFHKRFPESQDQFISKNSIPASISHLYVNKWGIVRGNRKGKFLEL